MDRKSIISVILLTVVLFGMNQWFSWKYEKQNQEVIKEKRAQEQQEQQASLRSRSISPEQLPLAKVYTDAEGKNFVGFALNFDNTFILPEWTNTLPKEVFVRTGSSLDKATLSIENTTFAKTAVYSSSQNAKIPTSYLPQVGNVDLQIVNLKDKNAKVALGILKNNRLTFPNNDPLSGIAVYEVDGRFLPVGYYNSIEKKYTSFSDIPAYQNKIAFQLIESSARSRNEQFYVLENDYLQVVFSTIGGSIAEINLPFESDKNDFSVVKPIEVDRLLKSQYPYESYFPNYSYYLASSSGQIVKENPTLGGYYPLLRRDIRDPSGVGHKIPYQYYSLSTLSDYSDDEISTFKVTSFTSNSITFEGKSSGKKIRKSYFFDNTEQVPYSLMLEIEVDGDARGLWLSTGIPEVELISGAFMPSFKYQYDKNGKQTVDSISTPKNSTFLSSANPNWISNSNGFFGIIVDPVTFETSTGVKVLKVAGEVVPSRLTVIGGSRPEYPANKYPGYQMLMPLTVSNKSQQFRIVAGPYQQEILKQLDVIFTNPANGYNPDYAEAQSHHGWFSFISVPFAKFLFVLMNFFHMLTHSWGFSIILLTIALRVMLYPLNAWSIKSTLKLQQLSPKITALQEKNKKDPKKAQMEMVKLYKENGVNPFSGCFPILIQMPFLIGMFDLLKSSFQLRGASFIPGWINNLSSPDVVFSWGFSIPFIGNEFHLLPILLGGVMFLQQRFSQSMNKKAPTTDQQRQQQAMGNMMTIVFTVIFYKMPSGLNIYFLSSTLLSILQQWYMHKKLNSGKAGK